MKIGVPKETKNGEYRVGLTPHSVSELVAAGHEVFIEHDASTMIGYTDENYSQAGAVVLPTAPEVFQACDMVVKIKEPSLVEAAQFKEGQIIFCYLHLAPNPALTQVLLERKVIGVAFETVTSKNGNPLLCPMSVVAGRMATQVGARLLETANGGNGVLISGVPGAVDPAVVVIIGGGTVGQNAADIAIGMGALVTIFDNRVEQLNRLSKKYDVEVNLFDISNKELFEREVTNADIVIGATHVAGALTDKLVSEEMVMKMKKGSVIVDVSIDQGGCFETSRVTSHAEPTFIKHGVVHYCVPNMPGNVPYTSTHAINKFLLPYVLDVATNGLGGDKDIVNGIHVYKGQITNQYIADTIAGSTYVDPASLI